MTAVKKFIPFFIAGVFLLAGVSIFYVSSQNAQKNNSAPAAEENGVAINPSDLNIGESTQSGRYTIERLPDAPNEPTLAPPSLARPVVRPASMEDVVFVQIQSNISQTVAVLKEGSDFNAWMNLSTYRIILEDYQGAEEILLFLAKRFSPSWQVRANLGNLYATYLVDLDKAAAQYEEAIALLPQSSALYRSLFEVYARQNNSAKAIATLKSGIQNEPKAIDLYILLARYFRDGGQTVEARTYYDLAIEHAAAAGNASLKADLEAERAL